MLLVRSGILTDDSAINVVIYNAGDFGNSQSLAVEISGTYANGTRFFDQALDAKGTSSRNDQTGIYGECKGISAQFSGSDLGRPNVENELRFGSAIRNSILLLSTDKTRHIGTDTAHYPCDPNVPGVSGIHLPRFYWANAVPDADVAVDLHINGTRVRFEDIGYHDKNWGDRTILNSPNFWGWGHARVGPYSVVWYDFLDYDDNEHHRSYIAKDCEMLKLSRADDAVITRSWGTNVI